MSLKEVYNRIAEDWHKDHLSDTWSIDATNIFAANFPAGAEILDVGCAGAIKSKHLVAKGLRVTGIDISEAFIEIAKRECPEGDFIAMDMRDVAKLGKQFDGVFVLASLLHIPKAEVPGVLKGFESVLKPGGYLSVSVKEQKPGQPEEQLLKEDDYGYEYERFFSYFQANELEQFIVGAGLVVKKTTMIPFGNTNWINVLAMKK
jgi:2-polyprenyl-3-methyl-5-hydroxy-6-metoxy-1,4-benzoquinol methylase